MARKQRTGDSTDVYFDTRTKAVLTQTSHNSMANVKEQLAGVREVVPNARKEDILLVLQHFDGDVPKTIQAFMEDGAEDILKEWNVPNRRKTGNNVNKRNKKKRPKQPAVPQEDGTVSNGLQEEHIPNNNNIEKPFESKMEAAKSAKVEANASAPQPKPVSAAMSEVKPTLQQAEKPQSTKKSMDSPKQRQPRQQQSNKIRMADAQSQPRGRPDKSTQSKSQEPKEHPMQAQSQSTNPRATQQYNTSNKPASGSKLDNRIGKDESGQRSAQSVVPRQGQSSEGTGKRDRNVSESSSVADSSRSKKTGATLDKSSKDLQRTVVSLTRHKNLLAEEIEKAEKRLKKAFDDARTSLSTREEDLMRQLQEVKRQATSLLEDRQHRAFELKQEISRAANKSDHDLLELRADIKHFVSERKIDEDIGRSSRFTGSPDVLQEAIKTFGEVTPVKTLYSVRRPSITSLTSQDSLSRPTSISDDHGGLLSRSASTIEGSVNNGQGATSMPETPTSPMSPDADMDSEVAKMAAKMQRSLQSQRGRGPRNPRHQGDRQGPQGSAPRQGQSAKEGSRQDQRGNRGHPDSNNQSSHRRGDERPQQERWHDRPRTDRPRGDRGEGFRGKEEPRNKDRNIRRREQYRRRHDQGSDTKPESGADNDVKNNTSSVPRPDSIPIPQNGPSPVPVDKKPTPAVNGDIPAANGNIADKPKPPAQPEIKPHIKKDSDMPLVNGNAISSAETTPTEALPQRKPREERNRKKVEEVVKEVTSMNGMMNSEVAPVMVNGET